MRITDSVDKNYKMPTPFTDSEINLDVITTGRQNSYNEETDILKSEGPKSRVERRIKNKRRNGIILTGFVLMLGITGWLTWLTMITLHPTQAQLPPPQPSTETKVMVTDHGYEDSKKKSGGDGLSGIAMVLDVASLLDKTTMALRYQTTVSKFNFSRNGVQYYQDGSFKILKSSQYLIHSKLSLTNTDFTKTKSFRQCVMVGDDASLECDQGSVSPGMKKNSQIWRFEYLEQNQILKVIMTNKDLVYRDPFYSKIEIVELAKGT